MAGKKPRTEHETIPLNRGNIERAAQLARKAAASLDATLAGMVDTDEIGDPVEAKFALFDALTELGA